MEQVCDKDGATSWERVAGSWFPIITYLLCCLSALFCMIVQVIVSRLNMYIWESLFFYAFKILLWLYLTTPGLCCKGNLYAALAEDPASHKWYGR